MKTSLYRYFCADGSLLYVGIAHHPFGRMNGHKRLDRMAEVATISVEWHDSRKAAIAAERATILAEDPAWNVVRPKPPETRKPKRSEAQLSLIAKGAPIRKLIHMAVVLVKCRGMNRPEIAKGAGIAPQTLNAYLAGQRDGARTVDLMLDFLERQGITFDMDGRDWLVFIKDGA